jgi:hypothetical protein
MSSEGSQPARGSRVGTLNDVFGADRRSLALFRMLIGADFVYEWINRATSLTAHYTDDGVLPRALMPAVARRLALPIFRLSGGATVQATLMIVACLFAVMLMVGYRTRLATIATWILHLAVIERLPSITGGGDNLMRYLLLWSMFVPLGACWSVDHWLSRRRGAASPPAGNGVGPPIVSLGVAALFVQLASIYFCAGVHKLEHPAWRQGLAVCRALQVYTRTTPLGDWMLNFPHFLAVTSLVLPVLQILGAVYLFVPFLMGKMRTLIVFSYAAFQITLGASIVLGNFQQVAVFMMVPFLPPWFWDHLLPKLGIGRPTISPAAPPPEDAGFLSAKWRAAFRRSPLANRVSERLAAALGVYLLVMNLGGCLVKGDLPGRPERLGYALNFDQNWDLFSLPEVNKPFGWFVAPAKLADGRTVDLLTGSTQIDWTKPAPFSLTRYVNWRWRLYYGYFQKIPENDPRKAAYPRYLARTWNSTHPKSEQVESLEIVSVSDVLATDGKFRGAKPTVLWKGEAGSMQSAVAD